MNTAPINFPQFRKYAGDLTFFRIDSEESFTEIKKMGAFYISRIFTARNYADRLMISDMLNCGSESHYQFCEQKEYEERLLDWSENLQLFKP